MRLSRFIPLILLAGCWTPNPPDGAFACNPTGKACPDGYSCLDGACWKNGHFPDLSVTGDDVDLGGGGTTDDLTAPKKILGDKCDSADVCGSGFCVDGVCCDTACTGQCQACDTQTLGTCSTVTGPPHGARQSCTGAGSLCGGTCDGASASTCTYPSTQTICGAACDGKCNGAGACSTGGGATCPNGFACGTNMCLTACSTDNDCQANFKCTAPNCVRVPESDCLDGLDNNGDGLADCADPTCNTQVTCVPAPSAGNEIGLFQAAACPTSNYSTSEHLNQSLQVPTTCSGCAYSGAISCSVAFYFDYSTTTCSSLTYIGIWNASAPSCLGANGSTPQSVSEYVQTGASTCNVTNAGTRDPVSWGTSANFCAASRSSATCTSNNVCVAKPQSASVCIRVPSPSAACPAGYTATPKGTWYGDGDYSDGRACACQPAKSGGSCGTLLMSTGSTCAGAPTGMMASSDHACQAKSPPSSCGGFGGSGCWNSIGAFGCWNSSGTVQTTDCSQSDSTVKPTCSVATNGVTGTATPTGGSTICCQ